MSQIVFTNNGTLRMTTTRVYDYLNRLLSVSSTDSQSSVLSAARYQYNEANQRTQLAAADDSYWTFNYDSLGQGTATVLVNGQSAYRKGEYFRAELAENNSSAALYPAITNRVELVGVGTNEVTGNLFLPQTPEAFTYDPDGNLTSDGRWTNTWNGQNQLVSMQSLTSGPSGSLRKLDFTYDYAGRRIQKIVSTNNAGTYSGQTTNRYVYDGWNLLAELNHTNGLVRSYLWGLDLSGTLQGAGGVGGLLAVKGSTNGAHFCAYDGNAM